VLKIVQYEALFSFQGSFNKKSEKVIYVYIYMSSVVDIHIPMKFTQEFLNKIKPNIIVIC
jgi:hypothetical protein